MVSAMGKKDCYESLSKHSFAFYVVDQGVSEYRENEILATVATSSLLAVFTVILRLYTRLLVRENASRDDLFIVLAVVS